MAERRFAQRTKARRARGFFLIWSLLMAGLLSSFMAASLTRSHGDLTISQRHLIHEGAFHLAEAGLNHAFAVLKTSSLDWNDELAGQDGISGTGDDGILSFGAPVFLPQGAYAVRISDNEDEVAPTPNDPATDVDGVIRIDAAGTTQDSQRAVSAWVQTRFNYAIAAQLDILFRQASAMGDVHANRNIEVRQTSSLLSCSEASAAGSFIIPSSETLLYACGDLVGGDPLIVFPRPNEDALRAAVTRWNASNWRGTILLVDRDIIGYDISLDVVPDTPQTVLLTGSATIVMFDGTSVLFRDRLGTFRKNGTCLSPVNLNVIALGGSITFEQPVCLRGLVWAEGDIIIAQDSLITGAVVSAGGSIDVRQESQVIFDRTAFDASLLPGFGGVSLLAWQEQP